MTPRAVPSKQFAVRLPVTVAAGAIQLRPFPQVRLWQAEKPLQVRSQLIGNGRIKQLSAGGRHRDLQQ